MVVLLEDRQARCMQGGRVSKACDAHSRGRQACTCWAAAAGHALRARHARQAAAALLSLPAAALHPRPQARHVGSPTPRFARPIVPDASSAAGAVQQEQCGRSSAGAVHEIPLKHPPTCMSAYF